MGSFVSYKSELVPAGKEVTVNITGNFFVCKESTAMFNLSIDDGESFPMEVGLGFRLNPGDTFTKVRLANTGAADITVQFYVGAGEVQDNRLNSSLDRVSASVRSALTTTTGQTASIATASYLDLAGLRTVNSYANARRKTLIVTNLDPTSDIKVTLGAATGSLITATIFPRTAWAADVMDDARIYNPSGGSVSVNVCELFYT